jgi:hypothetical protein
MEDVTRTPWVGRAVFIAVAVIVIGATIALGFSGHDSVPVATSADIPRIDAIAESAWIGAFRAGRPNLQSGRIVRMREHSALGQLPGQFDPNHDPVVYFIQIAGDFSYAGGLSPHVWHAGAISTILNAHTLVAIEGGFDGRTANVSLMGTPYRLPPPKEHLVSGGPADIP